MFPFNLLISVGISRGGCVIFNYCVTKDSKIQWLQQQSFIPSLFHGLPGRLSGWFSLHDCVEPESPWGQGRVGSLVSPALVMAADQGTHVPHHVASPPTVD